VIGGALDAGLPGFITAQGRTNSEDGNGFVFNYCHVFGNGTTYLGRPWRSHARVLFYKTNFSNVVQPAGWDAWRYHPNEYVCIPSLSQLIPHIYRYYVNI